MRQVITDLIRWVIASKMRRAVAVERRKVREFFESLPVSERRRIAELLDARMLSPCPERDWSDRTEGGNRKAPPPEMAMSAGIS